MLHHLREQTSLVPVADVVGGLVGKQRGDSGLDGSAQGLSNMVVTDPEARKTEELQKTQTPPPPPNHRPVLCGKMSGCFGRVALCSNCHIEL